MDLPRKIGVGIVMLVPIFVGSGALWAAFASFIPVIIWVIVMALVAGKIMKGGSTPASQRQGFQFG